MCARIADRVRDAIRELSLDRVEVRGTWGAVNIGTGTPRDMSPMMPSRSTVLTDSRLSIDLHSEEARVVGATIGAEHPACADLLIGHSAEIAGAVLAALDHARR